MLLLKQELVTLGEATLVLMGWKLGPLDEEVREANVLPEEELTLCRWGSVEGKLTPTDDEYDKGRLELNDLGILRCLTLLCLFKLAFVENFLPQFFALQGKTIAVACRCTWRR